MAMRKVAALAALRRLAACEAKIASPLLLRSPVEVNPQLAAKLNVPMQTRGFAAEPAPEPAAESTQLTDKTGSKMGSVKAVSSPSTSSSQAIFWTVSVLIAKYCAYFQIDQ